MSASAPARAGLLLALSYVGFVSLGLPDGLLGAAWPAMRIELDRALDDAGEALLLATGAIVLSSLLTGRLLARFATGTVLAASTLLAALALFLYARAPSWPFILLAAVCAGFGGGAVDAALNGFVARHYSVRHMNWLHGCWGIGATGGPMAVAAVLRLRAGDVSAWRLAYLVIFAIELALAVAFILTRRLWEEPVPAAADASASARVRLSPAMRANVVFFFFYTGVEAGAGLWGASLLVSTRGASLPLASALVSIYWGMLTVGRFVLGAVAESVGPDRLLRIVTRTALGALLVLSIPAAPLPVAALALGVLGLALAPIYPLLMHDTPQRFGATAARDLVGYQVAAASVGIATLPWLIGLLARTTSLLVVPPALAVLAAALVLLERRRRR